MAAAALQFPLAHPAVASVIPGFGKVRRVDQTLQLFETDIPPEFWSALVEKNLLRADAPLPDAARGDSRDGPEIRDDDA
jgi:D-threo-aldose 1-dehydrogenase